MKNNKFLPLFMLIFAVVASLAVFQYSKAMQMMIDDSETFFPGGSADPNPAPSPIQNGHGQIKIENSPAFGCSIQNACGFNTGLCLGAFRNSDSGAGWSVDGGGAVVRVTNNTDPSQSNIQTQSIKILSVGVDDDGSGTGWSKNTCRKGSADSCSHTGTESNPRDCAGFFYYPNSNGIDSKGKTVVSMTWSAQADGVVWNYSSGGKEFNISGTAINKLISDRDWGAGGFDAYYQVKTLVCDQNYVVGSDRNSCVSATPPQLFVSKFHSGLSYPNTKADDFLVANTGGGTMNWGPQFLNNGLPRWLSVSSGYKSLSGGEWDTVNLRANEQSANIGRNSTNFTVVCPNCEPPPVSLLPKNETLANLIEVMGKPFLDFASVANGQTPVTADYSVDFMVPEPTVTLSASATSVNYGDPVVLTWTSTNATVPVSSLSSIGATSVNGSAIVNPTTTTTYTITVQGVSGVADVNLNPGNFASSSVTVNVLLAPALPTFAISASPTDLFVVAGNAANSLITVAASNEFSQPVDLSISTAGISSPDVPLPASVNASFASKSVNPAKARVTSRFTLNTPAGLGAGTYKFNLVGTSGDIVKKQAMSITVTALPSAPPVLSIKNLTDPSRNPAFQVGDRWRLELKNSNNANHNMPVEICAPNTCTLVSVLISNGVFSSASGNNTGGDGSWWGEGTFGPGSDGVHIYTEWARLGGLVESNRLSFSVVSVPPAATLTFSIDNLTSPSRNPVFWVGDEWRIELGPSSNHNVPVEICALGTCSPISYLVSIGAFSSVSGENTGADGIWWGVGTFRPGSEGVYTEWARLVGRVGRVESDHTSFSVVSAQKSGALVVSPPFVNNAVIGTNYSFRAFYYSDDSDPSTQEDVTNRANVRWTSQNASIAAPAPAKGVFTANGANGTTAIITATYTPPNGAGAVSGSANLNMQGSAIGDRKYSCLNGSCVEDTHGTYISSDCYGYCAGPNLVKKYSCLNGSCVEDTHGTFGSSDCGGDCTDIIIPPPSCTFSENTDRVIIPPPSPVKFTWSCSNVSSCSVSSPTRTEFTGKSGSGNVSPSQTTKYTLSCDGVNMADLTVRVFSFIGGFLKEIPPQ